MKNHRIVSLLLVVMLLSTLIGTAASAEAAVQITFLNSKGEIQAQLEEAAKVFNADHPDISAEIIPCPAGKSPFEVMSTMYNSGNAPTLAMVDAGDVVRLAEKFAPLSDEKWVADAASGSLDAVTIDGKVYAFPFAIEGFGFIYNKQVLDAAFGGSFDPATITTRAALKDAFDKVVASGKKALIITPMDWSLGAPMFSTMYLATGKGEAAAYDELFASLKAGTYDLASNPVFTGWLETFDLLREYNSAKDDPMAITYEKGPELLGKGDVGFWYMGNWAWPQIAQFDTANQNYGFVPYVLSDNADDYGNKQVVAFGSKYVALDATQNSEAQQAAGKAFLNWLVYEANGQDALVNKANLVPAFTNIKLEIADPLGRSIVAHIAEGATIPAIDNFTVMPADHWSVVGAALQKYLSGYSDAATLAQEVQDYWKTVQ
jgi:raffinose/stachyose/melibiose transport system substrate-binding protein